MSKKVGYARYRLSPLKKVTAEAKRIRKKQPGKSWKTAIKEAARKYRAGTIGKVRKKAAPKKKARKGSTTAKRSRRRVRAAKVVRVVRVTRVGRVVKPRRHRMAGSGGGFKKFVPFILLGGAALIAWHLLRPKQPQLPAGVPAPIQTTNPVRNQQANEIVQYAVAAGLAIDAITKLIQSLNNRSDSDIQNIYDNVDQGGGLPPTLFA